MVMANGDFGEAFEEFAYNLNESAYNILEQKKIEARIDTAME
jgi:hypothetical protein